jgi:hypothetical protein
MYGYNPRTLKIITLEGPTGKIGRGVKQGCQ